MNWAFSIKNKMKAALSMLIICVVVLANNLYKRHNSEQVNIEIEALFADRLLAQDLLFKYTQEFMLPRKALR